MKLIKKLAAGVVALAMTASLFGCGYGTTWAAKSGDVTIPAGVFIYYEMSSYYEALEKVKANAAEGDSVTAVTKKDKVDDVPALEWIQNQATDKMRQYVAVENKFKELNLTLTDEEKENVDSMVDYYMSNFAENYKDNGISEESLRKAFLCDYKYSAIFKKYYVDEDGLEPVADDDIKSFYKDEFARVKMIEIKLKDGEGNLLKDAEKTKAISMAQDYLKKAQNGDDFDKLITEYNDYYQNLVDEAEKAKEDAAGAADPAETTPEETTAPDVTTSEEVTTTPEVTTTAEDETTTPEETTEPYKNEMFIHKFEGKSDKTSFSDADGGSVSVKNSEIYSEKLVKAVFEGNLDKPFLVEDEEVYYVVLRTDILALTKIYDNEHDNLIWELKEDDYKELVKGFTDAITLNKNSDAFKRYDPFKLKV